jgi:hypothetical protein
LQGGAGDERFHFTAAQHAATLAIVDAIIARGSNVNGWWRTYRSGRIEQGGVLDAGNLVAGWSTSTRILLPIAVPTASYSTFLTAETNDLFGNAEAFALGKHDQKSVNSFTIGIRNATSLAYDIKINWTATYGCPVSSRATTMPSGNGRQNQ